MAKTEPAEKLRRYPPDRAARYRSAGMWSEVPTAERFHQIASAFPDADAVVDPEKRMTYAELDLRSDQIAAGLHQLGLERGDAVIFQVTNKTESVLAWYAVLKAGGVPVATLAAHRMHEIATVGAKVQAVAHVVDGSPGKFDLIDFARQHAAESSTIRLILTVGDENESVGAVRLESLGVSITAADARRTVQRIQREIRDDDVAVFQLSGGTTGTPKVIPRLHGEYWNNALFYSGRLGRDHTSRVAHLLPLIHNAGIVCALHGAHSVGGCLVLPPSESEAALQFMRRNHVTDTLIGAPHHQWMYTDDYVALSETLKSVVISGGKVPEPMFNRATELGAWVGQLYGMAEGLFVMSPIASSAEARKRFVGTPLTEFDEVRLLSADGTDVTEGQVGEVACRGPYTIPGYYDEVERNTSAFTEDGYYRTGDLGIHVRHDDRLFLSIEGRIKDVVDRGGEKVNAEEVEMLLVQHPAISDAAVVGMPDSRLGERACAFLVSTGEPLELSELAAHFERLGVAKFKWPERLEWVEAIPRTAVSKIDKKLLRRMIAEKLTSEGL